MGKIRIITGGGLRRLEKNALTSVPVLVFVFFPLSSFSFLRLNVNKHSDQICVTLVRRVAT